MFEHLDRFVWCIDDAATAHEACATGKEKCPPSPISSSGNDEDLRHTSAEAEAGGILSPLTGAEDLFRDTVTIAENRPVSPVVLDRTRACVYSMIGFFQCARYFDDHPLIRNVIPTRLYAAAKSHLKANYTPADADDVHCVGVHIRRGDYVHLSHIFAELSFDYYDAALQQLLGRALLHGAAPNRVQQRRIVVLLFCDDVSHARCMAAYWTEKYPGVRVTPVHASSEVMPLVVDAHQPRDVVEMLMLSLCDDIVMANSTFSWWSAYLNAKPLHRVVAPVRWFVQDPYPRSNHLYCDSWLLV